MPARMQYHPVNTIPVDCIEEDIDGDDVGDFEFVIGDVEEENEPDVRVALGRDVSFQDEEEPSTGSSTQGSLPSAKKAPPAQYVCPLTLRVMSEPVSDRCGHCFDKQAIFGWLESHDICPISRKPLASDDLRPNHDLQHNLVQWKQEQERRCFSDIHDCSVSEPSERDPESGDAPVESRPGAMNYYSEGDLSGMHRLSAIELMLLPQERDFLRNILVRSNYLRKLRRQRGLLSVIALMIGTALLAYLGIELYIYLARDMDDEP